MRAAFAHDRRPLGKVDALLNVAGVARIRRIEDATDDDIAFVFGVNLLGPIYTTRAAIPLMRAAGAGDIVNVSSEITDDYMPRMVLYGASKGGLDTFSRDDGARAEGRQHPGQPLHRGFGRRHRVRRQLRGG